MRECVILASMPVQKPVLRYVKKDAFLIAVDAGWQHAERLGLAPDLILGDFDSAPPPAAAENLLTTPAEKDDTDTMLAVREAVKRGMESVVILGGLGGRLDHTLANLQALAFLAEKGIKNLLADETTEARCVMPGELVLEAQPGRYLSVFAFGGQAQGVDLCGVKYPLSQATLLPTFPIGVSNEFLQPHAVVRHFGGCLLVVTAQRDCGV